MSQAKGTNVADFLWENFQISKLFRTSEYDSHKSYLHAMEKMPYMLPNVAAEPALDFILCNLMNKIFGQIGGKVCGKKT